MNKQMKIIFGGLVFLLILLLGVLTYLTLVINKQKQYKKTSLSTVQSKRIKSNIQEKKKDLSWSGEHKKNL